MSAKTVVYLLVVLAVFYSLFLGAKMLKAQDEDLIQDSDISLQLQQIIQNQQVIISKLDEMKEELRIIKIRASIRRGRAED